MLEAVGSGEGELNDLEATIDGGLHGLGAGLRGGSAQDGTGPNLGELVEDGLVVVDGLGAVEAAEGTGSGGGVEPGSGDPGGGRASGTEGHGCMLKKINDAVELELERMSDDGKAKIELDRTRKNFLELVD